MNASSGSGEWPNVSFVFSTPGTVGAGARFVTLRLAGQLTVFVETIL